MYYREATTDNQNCSFKTMVKTGDRLTLGEARRLAFKIAGGRLRKPALTAWFEPGTRNQISSTTRSMTRQATVQARSGEVNVDVGPGDYYFIFTEANSGA